MLTKKMMLYGTAVVVSGAVMVTSGISAMANGQDGYQVLKSAMKQTHQLESGEVTGTVNISDNQTEVAAMEFGLKGSTSSDTASGTLAVEQNGVTQEARFYRQNGQSIFQFGGDDTYYVKETSGHFKHSSKHASKHGQMDPAMQKRMEELLDTMVGKYRTYFELEDRVEQGKVVTLSLDDQEMPALMNAVGALWIEQAFSTEAHEDLTNNPFHKNWNLTKPEIGTDVHIEQVDLRAVIDADNYIREQTVTVEASSKDAAGQEHTWTFDVFMELSDLNGTEADSINLDGKKVEVVKSRFHH